MSTFCDFLDMYLKLCPHFTIFWTYAQSYVHVFHFCGHSNSGLSTFLDFLDIWKVICTRFGTFGYIPSSICTHFWVFGYICNMMCPRFAFFWTYDQGYVHVLRFFGHDYLQQITCYSVLLPICLFFTVCNCFYGLNSLRSRYAFFEKIV
jgi:hypothetical protein